MARRAELGAILRGCEHTGILQSRVHDAELSPGLAQIHFIDVVAAGSSNANWSPSSGNKVLDALREDMIM